MVFNKLCKHFSDSCAPLGTSNSAISSSANSATWSKYNFFNFFNGCQKSLSSQILLITLAHSRSTSHRLFEHSLARSIIYQAIFYQTTVVIRIQTQIKTITLYFHKTYCQLSSVSNLHVYHSGHTLVLHTISVSYRPNTQSQG